MDTLVTIFDPGSLSPVSPASPTLTKALALELQSELLAEFTSPSFLKAGSWRQGGCFRWLQDNTFRTDDTHDETDQKYQMGPERWKVHPKTKRSKPFWEWFSILLCIHYSETKWNPFPVHLGNSCLHQDTPGSYTRGLSLVGLINGLMSCFRL